MSKSKGNTVDPQMLIDKYGADTVRLFTMFAAPPEQSLEWNDDAVDGAFRFLKRLWRLVHIDSVAEQIQHYVQQGKNAPLNAEAKNLRSTLHQLLEQANRDVERYQFNTVVSAAMKMQNVLSPLSRDMKDGKLDDAILPVYIEGLSLLLRLLAPITPHICHSLWQSMGYRQDILYAEWPRVDTSALVQDSIEYIIQVNGKLRAKLQAPADADDDALTALAKADENVGRHLQGVTVRKVIIVPKRLINIVVS